MLLALSTWCDVEAYLERSKAIILPIGSMEQHGPNGLIGTDAICPEVIAAEAAAEDPDILVGPTFSVGCAQHHLAFPGTMTLRPSTMIAPPMASSSRSVPAMMAMMIVMLIPPSDVPEVSVPAPSPPDV